MVDAASEARFSAPGDPPPRDKSGYRAWGIFLLAIPAAGDDSGRMDNIHQRRSPGPGRTDAAGALI